MACVRARGSLVVDACLREGKTWRGDVHESGALRVRFPREHMARLDATIVNVAGGMTGGDHFDMNFAAKAGAQLFASSAAAEKIYRSEGEPARITVRLSAAKGAFCAWLPQETIIFNRANLVRTLEADIADDARFIACEMTILGRAAMNETMDDLRWSERWRIRRAGKLAFAEDTRIGGHAGELLAGKATGAGAHAFATLIYSASDSAAACANMRSLLEAFSGACEAGLSAFDDLAVARFVAQDGQSLRACVMQCLTAIPDLTLPRGWHT